MARESDLVQIEKALGDLMRVSSSERLHAARLQATGLKISRTELGFLNYVEDLGPLPVSQLAEALGMSQPTASRTLRELESQGLVCRRPDASDGRVAMYEVTPDGSGVRRRMREYMHAQLAGALAGLSDGHCHDLAVALEELVTRLCKPPSGAGTPQGLS